MELRYLLHALLKRKWIILGCTFLTILISGFFLLIRDQVYESSAQYSTGFTIQQVSLVNEDINPYETDTKFNNVLETFNSPKVIGMLSYNLMLHDFQNPNDPFRRLNDHQLKSDVYRAVNQDQAKGILKNKIDSLDLLSTVNPDEANLLLFLGLYDYDYSSIEKGLLIERIPRTDYLNISFKSEDPYLSAYVVNKIGEEFLIFYNSLSSTLTAASVQKIANIVEQKKRQVDSITENLTRERDRQGSTDPVEANKNTMALIAHLQSNLADERSAYNHDVAEEQSIKDQLDNLGTTQASQAAPANNNLEIVRLRKKISDLAPNKEDPKVADQISKLQTDLNKLLASPANDPPGGNSQQATYATLMSRKSTLDVDMSATSKNMAYLSDEIASYSRSLRPTGTNMDAKIEALRNEADIATKEYSDIKSKYSQAEGLQETPVINFRQTLVGQPAVDPVPSHTLLILGISGFSMLAFSSLIFILLELLDSSIKSPSRFIGEVGLPLLNPVNRIDTKKRSLQDLFNSSPEEQEKYPKELLFVRFMRKLRFDLETGNKKVILITSTKKAEGKTTLIEAIAYSLSMTNKKVLLVDTNFSHNTLTRHFNVEGKLEDFSIPSERPGAANIESSISPTHIKLVDVIGCRGGDYTPDEILDKNYLMVNLKLLMGNYDHILLEGASLNDHSDSKELTRYADGVLAVFSADTVINQLDKESIEFLSQLGPKFMGCVLNKVEMENIDS